MGICFSSDSSESSPSSTAQVVSVNGSLHKYNLPVFVSQVIQAEVAYSSSSSSNKSTAIFLCNSDQLSYDEYIPAMNFDNQLQPDQIYFVLPKSRLQHRLSSRDMAALAVKASVAIQNDSKNDSNRRKKARISPIAAQSFPVIDKDNASSTAAATGPGAKSFAVPQPRYSRSGSIKKLQIYASRRAKLAVRSFKLRLSTIHEGKVL